MSSTFAIACWTSFGLVTAYGLGLLFAPDWFLGKYIYKNGLWKRFTDHGGDKDSKNILHHLMAGLGLTWLSWAGLAYAFMAFCKDADMKTYFAVVNIVIWVFWAILDNAARCAWRLYAPVANFVNFIFTVAMISMWSAVLVN